MKTLGYYNGKYDELENMMIPMADRTHWFGDGVYDATNSIDYRIIGIDQHIDRFFNSAKLLDINLGFSKQYLADLLNELIKKLDDGNLMVYWQVSRGGHGVRSHAYDKNAKANLWIQFFPQAVTDLDEEYRLTMMEDKRYLYCNIKTLNLEPSVLAYQLARERNCNETVFHRGNIVTECAHSNIHILQDGTFITHPTDEFILAGIARANLLEACKDLNIPVEERPFTIEEMMNADEVIVSNSGEMCMRVYEIDDKAVGGKDSHTLNKLKQYIYDKWIAGNK